MDQMAGYAHLLFERYDRATKVCTHIVQPQFNQHSPIEWVRDTAKKHVFDILNDESDHLKPTLDGCRYCPAYGSCEATKTAWRLAA